MDSFSILRYRIIMRLTFLSSALLVATAGLSACNNSNTAQKSSNRDSDAPSIKFGKEAQAGCDEGVDDYLRASPHGFSWNDEGNHSFDNVKANPENPDILTLTNNSAKLANASHNFYPITLNCIYNVRQKKVLKYTPSQPSLQKAGSNIQNDAIISQTAEYIPSTEPVDRTEKFIPLSVSQKEVPSTGIDLEIQAASFLSEYYQAAQDNPEQAIPWMLAHYKPVINFFGKQQSLDQIIAQKRNYLIRWPIRSYRLIADTVTNQCNKINMTCQSNGTLDFEVQSLERKAFSNGKASFSLSIDFSNSTPYITSENSQIISR